MGLRRDARPPRARGRDHPAGARSGLIAVTWNIHRGLSALFRPSARLVPDVLAEIGPDLVALQEAQLWGAPAKALLDEDELWRRAGLRVLRPKGVSGQGFRGNVLLAGARVRVGADARPTPLPLGGWEPRGALLADVEAEGLGALRVACAHLSLGAPTRARQARKLLAALLARDGGALLLADLNEARGGAVAALRGGGLDGPPPPPAFPSVLPLRALDHALGAPAGLVAELRVHATPKARAASDHLPLVARLSGP